MPSQPATADRLDLATGVTLRTCRVCSTELPLTPDNFYTRPGRPAENRCQPCRRARNAQVRQLRRSGTPVRSTVARKFGIEIECIVDRNRLLAELANRNITASWEGYTHRQTGGWKIVTDASVSGGYELVSPPLSGAAGVAQVEQACAALRAAGARVNQSCGLHIHHEVTDLDAAAFGRLMTNWAASQSGTDQLVAPSRRNCRWAEPLRSAEVRNLCAQRTVADIRYAAGNVYRYRSLNVSCFPRYGTVEVRQHQGTINFKKISSWLAFGQAMITAAKTGATVAATDADSLIDQLAASGNLAADKATYLKGRAAHFARPRTAAAA